jgi:hypothetical protein
MFYKIIPDGYITIVGTGRGGIQITEEEYERLISHIESKPQAPEGFEYRLREDLSWELFELPMICDNENEISGDELISMIEEVL